MNDLTNTQANKMNWKRRYNIPVPIDMNVDMTIELMKTISIVKPTF
jgi:hypothetical protein